MPIYIVRLKQPRDGVINACVVRAKTKKSAYRIAALQLKRVSEDAEDFRSSRKARCGEVELDGPAAVLYTF